MSLREMVSVGKNLPLCNTGIKMHIIETQLQNRDSTSEYFTSQVTQQILMEFDIMENTKVKKGKAIPLQT